MIEHTYEHSKLGDTPVTVLFTALDDLKNIEASPDYSVNMIKWADSERPVCEVCLAGGCMVGTLDMELKANGTMDELEIWERCDSLHTYDRLMWLDNVREMVEFGEGVYAMTRLRARAGRIDDRSPGLGWSEAADNIRHWMGAAKLQTGRKRLCQYRHDPTRFHRNLRSLIRSFAGVKETRLVDPPEGSCAVCLWQHGIRPKLVGHGPRGLTPVEEKLVRLAHWEIEIHDDIFRACPIHADPYMLTETHIIR